MTPIPVASPRPAPPPALSPSTRTAVPARNAPQDLTPSTPMHPMPGDIAPAGIQLATDVVLRDAMADIKAGVGVPKKDGVLFTFYDLGGQTAFYDILQLLMSMCVNASYSYFTWSLHINILIVPLTLNDNIELACYWFAHIIGL